MKYSIKLINYFENNDLGYNVRIIRLRSGGIDIDSLIKIPRYNIDKFIFTPVNEVYIKIPFSKIISMNVNSISINYFIDKVSRRTKKDKINILIMEIFLDNIINNSVNKTLNLIVNFTAKVIYNTSNINIIVPPLLNFKYEISGSEATNIFLNMLYKLIELLDTYIPNLKIAYLIPSYISEVSEFLEFYIEYFGYDGLIVLDLNGSTFSKIGYSRMGQVIRIMKQVYKSENYGFYFFNHKSRKRSGRDVPSEDLLGLFSGGNFSGPSHKRIKMPLEVVNELKKIGGDKLFNKDDFLFYPVNLAPNIKEFKIWVKENMSNIKNISYLIKIFNDIQINQQLSCLHKISPLEILNSLKNNIFINTLKDISRKINRLLKNRPISEFLLQFS